MKKGRGKDRRKRKRRKVLKVGLTVAGVGAVGGLGYLGIKNKYKVTPSTPPEDKGIIIKPSKGRKPNPRRGKTPNSIPLPYKGKSTYVKKAGRGPNGRFQKWSPDGMVVSKKSLYKQERLKNRIALNLKPKRS